MVVEPITHATIASPILLHEHFEALDVLRANGSSLRSFQCHVVVANWHAMEVIAKALPQLEVLKLHVLANFKRDRFVDFMSQVRSVFIVPAPVLLSRHFVLIIWSGRGLGAFHTVERAAPEFEGRDGPSPDRLSKKERRGGVCGPDWRAVQVAPGDHDASVSALGSAGRRRVERTVWARTARAYQFCKVAAWTTERWAARTEVGGAFGKFVGQSPEVLVYFLDCPTSLIISDYIVVFCCSFALSVPSCRVKYLARVG